MTFLKDTLGWALLVLMVPVVVVELAATALATLCGSLFQATHRLAQRLLDI